MKIDLEEAREHFLTMQSGVHIPRLQIKAGEIGYALCAENKKLRELVGVQKEYYKLQLTTFSDLDDWEAAQIRKKELRTKIAELTKEMG